jgi:hypothetical protein
MSDDNSQNSGYMGGFTLGNSQAGGFVTPPPAPQPVVQPQQAPTPPPAPAAPQAPLAGMGDDFGMGDAAGAPAGDPNYVFGARMQTFTTTIKLPAHNLNLDDAKFLNLLAGSISLRRDEKKRIIDSIPKLRQEQVDELIRIFEEERSKFVELSSKHGAQLKKLEDEHMADWRDIELLEKQAAQASDEQAKAEEIRKQLGL